jgi:SAM-dependent methyltransferase
MRCEGCAGIYPDPRPTTTGLAAYYPEDAYYAYSRPSRHRLFARKSPAARLWYPTVRGILRQQYGYRQLGGSSALAFVFGRLPTVHTRAKFSLGVLLHPWRPDGALLDVGCGSGRYLDLMRALGWSRVVGVDIGETAVRHARESLGIEVHCGDLRDVAFPDASFDSVSLSHALEHMEDPVGLLGEVKRVTKPGGRIAIVVPNVTSLLSRLLREWWVGLETPRHVINFSPAALRIALAKSGLAVESLKTSPTGSYGVALFSISRARGDPPSAYTDENHRFGLRRRGEAAGLSAIERGLCAVRLPAGELICAVARA